MYGCICVIMYVRVCTPYRVGTGPNPATRGRMRASSDPNQAIYSILYGANIQDI